MSTLMALPTEMLRNICAFLVPEVIATGTKLPLPEEHQLRQGALWSLTLVSRGTRAIATEFLYKHLAIQSTEQMVCLFRTIVVQPDLRRYPQYLANLVPLMKSELQEEIEEDIQLHFPLLPSIVVDPTYLYPGEIYQTGSQESLSVNPLWTHEIIRHMVVMLPHLKDILTSIWGVAPRNPPAASETTLDEAFFADTPSFPPFSVGPRTLRLKWDVQDALYGGGPPAVGLTLFQLYFRPYISNGCRVTDLRFLNVPNVTNYEIEETSYWGTEEAFGPNYLERSAGNMGFLSWLAQIKTLCLGSSALSPVKVGRLLAACPNLKVLTWDPFISQANTFTAHDVELALGNAAGHLEQVNMILSNLHGPISFRRLRKLQVLSVGIEVLTNHRRTSERTSPNPTTPSMGNTPLASLLPNNLIRLIILSTDFRPMGSRRRRGTQTPRKLLYRDVMDGYVADAWQLYPTWLADGLHVFSRSCQAMPNFRFITIIQPFPSILPLDYIKHIVVGNLANAFDAVGVQLVTELTMSDAFV
ncbi:hypothetical protein F4859DRAFT_522065 [Xylaria cf. heliscus]|nr:hypothetical protein F4859DRAFT_522065 [Xylaria cf. heliscus]